MRSEVLAFLAFLAAPLVGFLAGRYIPPGPGSTPMPPAPVPAESDPSNPEVVCPPTGSAELDELEARWRADREQVEARTSAFEQVLYDAVDACALDIDVLAVDCDEEPCVVITAADHGGWRHAAGTCKPWTERFGQAEPVGLLVTVPCGDGAKSSFRVLTAPLASDDPHDHLVQTMAITSRVTDLAADWECAE